MKSPAWLKKFFGTSEGGQVPAQPTPVTSPAPAPASPAPAPSNPDARVRGVDVAKYQPTMDAPEWDILWKKGFRFAYAKATDGLAGKDAFHEVHRRFSTARGFLFGSYHYFRFEYDPKAQAAHFFKNAIRVAGELPPVLDVEWDKYSLKQPDGSFKYGEGKVMDDWAADRVYTCLLEIERLFGVRPIIYTNAYFWPEKVKNPERFLPYLCWIPSYDDKFNANGGAGVKVPFPWKQWNFWQDGEDLQIGDVQEIDTDWFRGTLEELQALANQ